MYHTEHGRNPFENIPCLFCEKPVWENEVKCPQCKIVRYCDDKCLLGHLAKHLVPCDRYVKNKGICGGNSVLPTASCFKAEGRDFETNGKDEKKENGNLDDHDGNKSMQCSSCNKRSVGLRTCSKCHVVGYCDADCQRKHWPIHKKTCKKTVEKTPKCEDTIHCSSCNEPNPTAKKCAKCMLVYYCDALCQRNHWREHKVVCERVSNAGSDGRSKSDDEGVKANSEGHGEIIQCFSCKKINPEAKKCTKCRYATYCGVQCQKKDFSQHKLVCGNYPKFIEALGRADPLLASLHDRDVTDMLYPPRIYISLLMFANPGRKSLLLEVVGPFHHFCREGVFVQDVKGETFHILFHHKPDEEKSLLPATLKNLLHTGNFIRMFYPRWHRFMDGEIGFRIDTLHEMEFIPKPLSAFEMM